MKEILESLFITEKERTKRYLEFLEYFKEIITTIPPQTLKKIGGLRASRYMSLYGEDIKDGYIIEFNPEDFSFWENLRYKIIFKKNGLSRMKEDMEIKLKVLDLELKAYLDEEE